MLTVQYRLEVSDCRYVLSIIILQKHFMINKWWKNLIDQRSSWWVYDNHSDSTVAIGRACYFCSWRWLYINVYVCICRFRTMGQYSESCRMCGGVADPGINLLDTSQQHLVRWAAKNLLLEVSTSLCCCRTSVDHQNSALKRLYPPAVYNLIFIRKLFLTC